MMPPKPIKAGAVFGGLIFVSKSPRYVHIEQARLVMSGAPLHYVGVFQNHSLQEVVDIAQQLSLKAVQLHGDEDQAYVDQLRMQLANEIEIWKAYGVSDSKPKTLQRHIDRHLFDSQVGAQSGGTGQAFNWQLLDEVNNVMLAGGINPDNAQQAASLGCLGLDLNSGVESQPGKKDQQKLNSAFRAIRHY